MLSRPAIPTHRNHVLRKAAGGSKRNQEVVARIIFQVVTICGAGKFRARLLRYWPLEMRQWIFQRSGDEPLLFVRPFETALLFEALFDFRGLALYFASY